MAKDVYPHIQIQSLDFDPDTSMGNIENRLQMLIMNARELEKLRSRSGGDLKVLRTSETKPSSVAG